MRKFVAVLAVTVLGFVSGAEAAQNKPDLRFAAEFGSTLPPIGYVKFCAENRDECEKKTLLIAEKAKMDSKSWQTLMLINSSVNTKIKPISDQDLYGEPERWTYPVTAGDCEDYLLLKKRDLEAKGFNASDLLITVVLDEKGEGHAVLTVATAEGDFVLDNRRDDILRWKDTGYEFLKRQSRQDPKRWVALREKPTTKVVTLSKP